MENINWGELIRALLHFGWLILVAKRIVFDVPNLKDEVEKLKRQKNER
jgi:hypothetical protein